MEIKNENPTIITQEDKKTNKWNLEKRSLFVLFVIFAVVILGAWGFAIRLQQTVAANNSATHADPSALIEIEKLRNLSAAQIDTSRAFFLLGSSSLFERQRTLRADFGRALTDFQEKYNLPKVAEYIKQIRELTDKTQSFFDQGMEFREKKTESKIVGQFFQSKTGSINTEINKLFDEVKRLHQEELDKNREEARKAAVGAELQIPQGMTSLTVSMAIIFVAMAFLVIRLVRKQEFQLAQQKRLYLEAQKAVQDRDETLWAISNDLKDSLHIINTTADRLAAAPQDLDFIESSQLMKSTVTTIEGVIEDIRDNNSNKMEGITLRMDQLPIDQVLENARQVMEPIAKEHGVRLQVDTVNPPILAFYDNDRVVRILVNLISNAIKFSARGEKVVVKVRSDQKFANISVIDTGTGIPSDQVSGIFDNFWQAKKTADQGAGIGLAMVKTLVTAHGGTVEMQSQSGRGTTVTFSLPRRRPVGAAIKKSTVTIKHSDVPNWNL
ncbi:sensor histidine kinase [Bdellovibrio sp. HCB2-146]|uniref:sensor histidine kinase n=1 Tax=Bdellovibrio sp. HCB2-146 TaxID=3394362 RepID=UPI0039BC887E